MTEQDLDTLEVWMWLCLYPHFCEDCEIMLPMKFLFFCFFPWLEFGAISFSRSGGTKNCFLFFFVMIKLAKWQVNKRKIKWFKPCAVYSKQSSSFYWILILVPCV